MPLCPVTHHGGPAHEEDPGREGQFDYASAEIYRTGDIDGILIYDGVRTDTWDVYDFSITPGSYCTTDGRATTTPDYEPASWRYDCSTVKFANSAGINGTRRGAYVDISAVAWRYDSGSSSFVRYPHATVSVQHRIPGSSTWSSLGSFRLDAGGRLNLHKYAPAVREYRMVTQTSGSFWSASSPTIRR